MNGWFALLAFAGAWLVAQLWKLVVGIFTDWQRLRGMTFTEVIAYIMRSGGMPSGHAASMVALSTYIGVTCGFGSEIFALALAVALIVVYDATHVRYAVGKQGEALNGLLREDGKPEVSVVEGHTLGQVIVGALIGVAIGLIMGFLVKA